MAPRTHLAQLLMFWHTPDGGHTLWSFTEEEIMENTASDHSFWRKDEGHIKESQGVEDDFSHDDFRFNVLVKSWNTFGGVQNRTNCNLLLTLHQFHFFKYNLGYHECDSIKIGCFEGIRIKILHPITLFVNLVFCHNSSEIHYLLN